MCGKLYGRRKKLRTRIMIQRANGGKKALRKRIRDSRLAGFNERRQASSSAPAKAIFSAPGTLHVTRVIAGVRYSTDTEAGRISTFVQQDVID